MHMTLFPQHRAQIPNNKKKNNNSLSNHVVSADTINTLKNRLDNFWSNKEVL